MPLFDVNPPICDMDPEHGPMQIEPMYGVDGETIQQFGWFCKVKNCDGYGGPVKNARTPEPKPKPADGPSQLTFLQE